MSAAGTADPPCLRGWGQALLLAAAINAAIFVLLPLGAGRMEPASEKPAPLRAVRITEFLPPRPDPNRPQRRPDEPPPLERPAAPHPRTLRPRVPDIRLSPTLPEPTVNVPAVSVRTGAPQAPAPQGFEPGEVDTGPRLLHSVSPDYPFSARSRNIKGTVLVRFLVDETGRVSKPSILSADPPGVFETNVLKAVRRWRFSPGRRHGRPVPTWVELPVRFNLSE